MPLGVSILGTLTGSGSNLHISYLWYNDNRIGCKKIKFERNSAKARGGEVNQEEEVSWSGQALHGW